MELKAISVSSAETWHQCHMKWLLSRDHKVPEDQKGEALRYGSAVHALAGTTAVLTYGAECEDMERVKAVDGVPYPPGFAGRFNDDAVWVHSILAGFKNAGYELEVERKIELPMHPVPFVGYVDLLASSMTLLVIADWKTTKKRRTRASAPMSLQLRAYAAWAARQPEHQDKAIECRLLFLDGQEISRAVFDEFAMNDALDYLARTAQEILDATPEDCAPSPTRLCDWCDHKALCPVRQVSGEF